MNIIDITCVSMKTSGAITGFLLVLWLYPDVSRRVYEEIQSVTHGIRLPKIADRPSLPYTEAVFKESLRIRPFLPIGQLHTWLPNYICTNCVLSITYRCATCEHSGRSP
jgi:hypothetical protein